MISSVNAFRSKFNIFSVHMQSTKLLHTPAALDRAVEKYNQLIRRLGQTFEERFCDFNWSLGLHSLQMQAFHAS